MGICIKGGEGKEAVALAGVFSVTDTDAGFILLVLSFRNAECAAAVDKLFKGVAMAGKLFVANTTSEGGVCINRELVGKLWCTEGTIEGSCFSGMMAVL